MHLIISLASIQPATSAMVQKELIIENTKLLLKMTISNLKKTWTNTALFEFGLAKSADLTKSEVQRQFPIFDFNLPFFKALPQDG